MLLLLLLHDHADNQARVERSHDTDPGHEVRVGDERGQLHREQRMATSLPWSLRLHAHQLARGSWRRGQDEGEIAKIREQLEGFDVELIFNMDETGLFYRCFPRGTYVTRVEGAAGVNKKTARGWKAMKAKDRCTVVACCNTTGSLKVPLAVIHTAKDPMVFPPCSQATLPLLRPAECLARFFNLPAVV